MSGNYPPILPLSLVNRGRVVQAVYREPEAADYVGNPLIEALPPVLTTEQAILGLAYYPHYDQAQRLAPDHTRYHLIQNGLRFFAPLDIHLDLERRFSCLIRVGYTERNPLACSPAAILNMQLFVIARRVLRKTGGDTARPIGIARIKRRERLFVLAMRSGSNRAMFIYTPGIGGKVSQRLKRRSGKSLNGW